MKTYSTLFLDLDDTLMDFKQCEEQALRRALKRNSIDATAQDVALYSEINRRFWQEFEQGKIRREDIFVNRFLELFARQGYTADAQKMSEDYFVCLSESHVLYPETIEVLTALRARGYRLYITSNGFIRTQYKRIRESGLEALVDGIFVSEKMGVQKPDKAYFEMAIAEIDEQDRRKILVVGDSLSADITGGINAGLDTCFLNRKQVAANPAPTYEILQLEELLLLLT